MYPSYVDITDTLLILSAAINRCVGRWKNIFKNVCTVSEPLNIKMWDT